MMSMLSNNVQFSVPKRLISQLLECLNAFYWPVILLNSAFHKNEMVDASLSSAELEKNNLNDKRTDTHSMYGLLRSNTNESPNSRC